MFGQDGWPVALTARSPVPLYIQTGSARRHQQAPVSRGDRVAPHQIRGRHRKSSKRRARHGL